MKLDWDDGSPSLSQAKAAICEGCTLDLEVSLHLGGWVAIVGPWDHRESMCRDRDGRRIYHATRDEAKRAAEDAALAALESAAAHLRAVVAAREEVQYAR